MKNAFIICFLLILSISLFSCSERDERVSILLREQADRENIDYDRLLAKCLEKDSQSIVTFSTLYLYDGAVAEHGSIVLDIIDSVGEIHFTEIIKNFTYEQKNHI